MEEKSKAYIKTGQGRRTKPDRTVGRKEIQKYDGSYVTEDFVVSKGKTYYFDADGNKAVGIRKIGGGTYAFDKKGVMQTGWQRMIMGNITWVKMALLSLAGRI